MASFTLGDFLFDIIDHERTVADGVVRERFVVDAFYQDAPLDWHPNQKDSEDFPGLPNRTNYEFVGREVMDIYENQGTEEEPVYVKVGTKRGADFRSRFWPNLLHHARKVIVATVEAKTITEVTDDEIDKTPYIEPLDLRIRPTDQAADALVGRAVR